MTVFKKLPFIVHDKINVKKRLRLRNKILVYEYSKDIIGRNLLDKIWSMSVKPASCELEGVK